MNDGLPLPAIGADLGAADSELSQGHRADHPARPPAGLFLPRTRWRADRVCANTRGEFLRLLSNITWGNGSIVVGGGTAGVAVVLGMTVGALVGIEGYNFLGPARPWDPRPASSRRWSIPVSWLR